MVHAPEKIAEGPFVSQTAFFDDSSRRSVFRAAIDFNSVQVDFIKAKGYDRFCHLGGVSFSLEGRAYDILNLAMQVLCVHRKISDLPDAFERLFFYNRPPVIIILCIRNDILRVK